MNRETIKKSFECNPWFQELPTEVAEEMIAMGTVRCLENGQFLYIKDDKPEGFYGIIEGTLRVNGCTINGKQALFTILGKGAWCGEVSILDDQRLPVEVVALGETKILVLPLGPFLKLMGRTPKLYKQMVKLVCEHYRKAFTLIEDNTLRSSSERLAKYLLSLSKSYGIPCENGVEINLRLSQEDLGMMVSTTRQRINKILKDWERIGAVKIKYGTLVILDPTYLNTLVSDI